MLCRGPSPLSNKEAEVNCLFLLAVSPLLVLPRSSVYRMVPPTLRATDTPWNMLIRKVKLRTRSQGAQRKSGSLITIRAWLSAGPNPDSQGCARLISVSPRPSSAWRWFVSLTLAQPVGARLWFCACVLTVPCFPNLSLWFLVMNASPCCRTSSAPLVLQSVLQRLFLSPISLFKLSCIAHWSSI